jgi:hypothetical protein
MELWGSARSAHRFLGMILHAVKCCAKAYIVTVSMDEVETALHGPLPIWIACRHNDTMMTMH